MPTTVKVTAADNELYILASQWNGSSELLHIKSGQARRLDGSPRIRAPTGDWVAPYRNQLGGPWAFTVKVGSHPFRIGECPVGDVWENTPRSRSAPRPRRRRKCR